MSQKRQRRSSSGRVRGQSLIDLPGRLLEKSALMGRRFTELQAYGKAQFLYQSRKQGDRRKSSRGVVIRLMNDRDVETLKRNDNCLVRITTYDGEVMIARVMFVSESNQDLIYDLVSTTKESQYEKLDEQPAYLIRFNDIESVEPVGLSGSQVDSGGKDPVMGWGRRSISAALPLAAVPAVNLLFAGCDCFTVLLHRLYGGDTPPLGRVTGGERGQVPFFLSGTMRQNAKMGRVRRFDIGGFLLTPFFFLEKVPDPFLPRPKVEPECSIFDLPPATGRKIAV